ncbi:MAG: hypothetical protein H6718_29675 [Polyangiaceae bacterium]|nr:hypothetical protein [Myxococcales bacterium]MCB9589621.1 hypothetical protein [Polyangiaceae bacterium]MCB9610319.1 hypothetical protein [Polyangiaceae bacterium]
MPSHVPARGADLRLGFQRIPPRSCILQPRLVDAQGALICTLRELTLYGRGEGSQARERAYVSVPLDPATWADLPRRVHQPKPTWIEICVLELDGSAVNEAGFLDLVEERLFERG